MNKLIKSVALSVLANEVLVARRLSRIKKQGYLTILNLHRVAPRDGSSYAPLEPELFRELLRFLLANFEVQSFSDLNSSSFSIDSIDKPTLVLTFDDGYKDFIEYVVPLLEEFKVRVNQNIVPECAISGLPPLNVLVQDFIGKAPSELLSKFDIPGFTHKAMTSDRERCGTLVSSFIKNKPFSEQEELSKAILPQIYKFDEFAATPMMSVSDIRECASHHDIGVHSYSHATMGYETLDYFRMDLKRCAGFFSMELGLSPSIYAFPNGSYTKEQVDTLLDLGYENILLVGDEFAQKGNRVSSRFGFHANSQREVYFRALGGLTRV